MTPTDFSADDLECRVHGVLAIRHIHRAHCRRQNKMKPASLLSFWSLSFVAVRQKQWQKVMGHICLLLLCLSHWCSYWFPASLSPPQLPII